MYRRSAILAVAAALPAALLSSAAGASTAAPFTQAEFERAQAAGQPILVDITASWCPTCAKQRPILERLAADPAFRDMRVFTVDFDSQKDVVRAMGARMQSTLIVFRGKDERGRSTGQTDPGAIRALLETSRG